MIIEILKTKEDTIKIVRLIKRLSKDSRILNVEKWNLKGERLPNGKIHILKGKSIIAVGTMSQSQ